MSALLWGFKASSGDALVPHWFVARAPVVEPCLNGSRFERHNPLFGYWLAALFLGEARELGPFFTGVLTVLTAVPVPGWLLQNEPREISR